MDKTEKKNTIFFCFLVEVPVHLIGSFYLVS